MQTGVKKPRSPKLRSDDADRARWYRYYAGYSADFVRDILTGLQVGSHEVVADPWNGSGTTTAVADELGMPSWGGDINPAMVVVAKARLLGWRVRPSEGPLCEGILDLAAKAHLTPFEVEPLRTWFRPEASQSIRAIERSIAALLQPGGTAMTSVGTAVAALSPLASFFYLALFRTVRQLVARFRCSNPTWICRPADERGKIAPSQETVFRSFRSNVGRMTGMDASLRTGFTLPVADVGLRSPASMNNQDAMPVGASERVIAANLAVAPSTALPLPSRSVTAVVSSPPYCTRIDYAVATSPELAVLGLSDTQLRVLREAMIGSSTVRRDAPDRDALWGLTCSRFLERVAKHPTKASSTYYLRNHLQYFDGLFRSLREIDRVLTPGAKCVLVVQDSHYKDVHNDLPSITVEMGQGMGWQLVERHDYPSTHHLARVHPEAQSYRKTTRATESVVVMATAR